MKTNKYSSLIHVCKSVVCLCSYAIKNLFFVHIEEENQAKRTTTMRRHSVADDKDRVALICKNVPPRFNNSQKLRQHFSKFGEVARVFPKPERGMATIHFKTHVSHYSYMYLINCDLLIKKWTRILQRIYPINRWFKYRLQILQICFLDLII